MDGSHLHGTAHADSDVDLVPLLVNLPHGAWRSMTHHKGHDYELFATITPPSPTSSNISSDRAAKRPWSA